jgi:hypothetical protein
VGFSYRIVFANQLAGGGQVKIGSISFKSSAGYSEWFGANSAGTVNLGSVTSSEGSDSSVHGSVDSASSSGSSSCKKDDGSAKKDPSSSDGVNVCLIWPTVILFPSVTIDEGYADKGDHVAANHDDDQTCGYWTVDGSSGASGGVIWGAPGLGLGFGYGAIEAGADIGLGASYGGSSSSSYSWNSDMNYSWNSNMGWSGNAGFNSEYHSSFSYSYSSSVNYSYEAGMGYAGTVAIAGGITLGVAYEFDSHVEVGGIIAGGYVAGGYAGGWAMSASTSVDVEVEGGVCVTAGACTNGLSCVAGTCVKQ